MDVREGIGAARSLPSRAARLLIGRGTPAQRQWRLKLAYALAGGDYGSSRISWREKAALARRGFLPLAHAMYDFAAHDHRSYLSDYERELTIAINGRGGRLLDDKVLFTLVSASLGVPTTPVRAIIAGGELRWLGASAEPIDAGSLRARLEQAPLVLKPVAGRGGLGFHALRLDGDRLLLNDEPVEWRVLERLLRGLDYFMVTDQVRQSDYSAQIFPHTTNTLRILTILRRGGTEPIIAAAVHRFGTSRSRPVDNWLRGGLAAGVDIDTGTLGPAVAKPGNGESTRHRSHPETGSAIAGVRVPRWQSIRRIVVEGGKALSFVPYIAWDVVATDTGGTVIEGNKFTSVDVFQVHAPLLDNLEVRAFFEEHGVLRPPRGA